MAACARARCKIGNESFDILKNNGYHLEHNSGHGKQNLALLSAAMNMLAFAIHTACHAACGTACDCLEDPWVKAREAKGARQRFFEHIRTITAYLIFADWQTLLTTLITPKPPPEIEKQIAG